MPAWSIGPIGSGRSDVKPDGPFVHVVFALSGLDWGTTILISTLLSRADELPTHTTDVPIFLKISRSTNGGFIDAGGP